VDGSLGLRVELVSQRDPHLGWVLHAAELFLDRVVDGEAKEGFRFVSSLLEGCDSKLKVGIIGLPASCSCRLGRRSLGRFLFFASDNLPCLHRLEDGLNIRSPFDVVRKIEAFNGSSRRFVEIFLRGIGLGGHCRDV